MLSSKNNRTYSKNKEKNKYVYSWDYTINHNENENENWKIDHIDMTCIDLIQYMDTNIVDIKGVSVWWCF